jgi:nucleoid DNA-binding protein
VLTRKDFVSSYKLSLETNEIEVKPEFHDVHCELFLELVSEYIKKGYVIRFQGCGAIVVRKKNERVGFNPRTGERFKVSPRRACSMIRTVRSSAKGIIQEKKITTQKLRTNLGVKIKNKEAAEVLVNVFLRMLQSIISGREDKLMLQTFGTFQLRKKISEGCLSFNASKELKEYLKAQV